MSHSAENRKKSKVIQKSGQSVSQKQVSHPEVPWRPKLGGPVALSKEVPVSRKPKEVESKPEVRSISQPETIQSAGSALAATIRWASGVVEGSPSQPKTETSLKSAISRVSLSVRNQSVSRKCPNGYKYLGQWRRRRKSQSAEKRNKSKVSHKSSQSVSQKPGSQLEVPWRPQLSWSMASSKEIHVSRKPKQVESQL